MPDQPDPADAIDQALRAGQKIQAIKLYRQQHGCDLKAAKEAVERRAGEIMPGDPMSKTSGCGATVLMLLVILACGGCGAVQLYG